jgi:P-type Cu+ transporter
MDIVQQERDPVCGMMVETSTTQTKRLEYNDKTFYFCSDSCLDEFRSHPDRYAHGEGAARPMPG